MRAIVPHRQRLPARRGRVHFAAAWLSVPVWLLACWVVWSTGGLSAPVVIAFIALGVVQVLVSRNAARMHAQVAREHTHRRAAEKRLLDVVDNAPFGAFVCALEGRRLRVVHVNQAASEVLSVDAARFVGSDIERTFSALSGKPLLSEFRKIAASGGTFHAESVPYFADGRSMTLELHAFQIGHDSMAVFFSDVTEHRREQGQIQRMAFHDHLTRLPNRSLLLDRLDVALASAQRHGYQVALLFIDLDGFKPINDRYGHAFGDELLVAVAKRLSDSARTSDTVARFGGDEFTVLVPDAVDREHIEVLAEKLGRALAQPFRIGDHTVSVTASIGVSITTPDDQSPTTLLEHADMAMYQVKRAGRNGYRVF